MRWADYSTGVIFKTLNKSDPAAYEDCDKDRDNQKHSHKFKAYRRAQAAFRSRKHDSHIETCRHPCSHQFLWIPKVLLSQPCSLKQALILRSFVSGPSESGLIVVIFSSAYIAPRSVQTCQNHRAVVLMERDFTNVSVFRGTGAAFTVSSTEWKHRMKTFAG